MNEVVRVGPEAGTESQAIALQKPWYMNSSATDTIFIILMPVISFLIVALICEPRYKNGAFLYGKETPYWFAIAATMLTHMHVLLVFTRSHMNMAVFKRYKYRFTLIPLGVLAAMWISPLLFGLMSAIGLYWDEWHSLMQTFGFGRIYDTRAGNPTTIGRKRDMVFCFIIGFLPALVLLTYLPEGESAGEMANFLEISTINAARFGGVIESLRWPLIAFGVGYSLWYFWSYYKLSQEGYRVSKAKIALFATTGITTIATASIFTVADGIFFGNIYHAIQYVFIVMISERSNLANLTGLKQKKSYTGVYLIYFLVIIPFMFALAGLRQLTAQWEYLAAFWLLTSLLHFWFDGFIWSVRRQDI